MRLETSGSRTAEGGSRCARLLLSGAALTVLAGCGAAAGTPGASVTSVITPSVTPSVTPSATPSASPTPSVVSALSFDLPTAPEYEPDGTRVGDDGQIVRTWRARPVKGGPACVVVAGEQPDFSGAFPAAALTAFRLGHEDGSEIQYDEAAPAIAGATAGLRQARTYRFSLGVRGTATGVVMVRQYLTAQRTLISLDVAGPADSASTCGLQGIVDSLRVASPDDQEPALVLPTPSATPSSTPSSTRSSTPSSTRSSTPTRRPSGTATRPSGAESTP